MNTVQKEKSSKKILELSDDENSIIVYQDEVHFHVQSTVTYGWYKKGSQPEIGSLPGRDKISYSGFVLPESGELFVNKPPMFNFQTTLDSIRAFLQAHPVPHGKKYVLLMDNASWHKKAARLVREDPQLPGEKLVFTPKTGANSLILLGVILAKQRFSPD